MRKVVRVLRDGNQSVVRVGDAYVRVNLETLETETSNSISALTASGGWRLAGMNDQNPTAIELANAASVSLSVNEATYEKRRVYRVPNIVKDEAFKALNWVRASTAKKFDPDQVQLAARISTSASVDIDTIRKVHELLSAGRPDDDAELSSDGTPSEARIAWSLAGGDPATRWTARILDKHTTIVAGAFSYEENTVYLGGGADIDSTRVNNLYKTVAGTEEFFVRQSGEWLPTENPADALLIELDRESAETLSNWVDDLPADHGPDAYLELRNILPLEFNIWDLARDEIDYEFIDRVITAAGGVWDDGRSPEQRSESASRQGRAVGGQFAPGGGPDAKGEKLNAFAKGRLPGDMPVLDNIVARINEYLVSVDEQRAPVTPDAEDEYDENDSIIASPAPETTTVEDATPDNTDVSPLYVAIVDEADPAAVLDVVAVIPAAAGTNQGPTAWRRAGGTWEFAPDLMSDLQGVTPPPVVELKDEATVKNVLAQVDESDAGDQSQADGGTTMAASGMWGPHGELLPLYAAGVPTVADTPKEIGNAERLRQYWTHGEGAAKIQWGVPGDWYRCVSHLSKYMGSRAKGYCTLRHHDAIGVWPGQEDGGKGHKGGLRASAEERLAPIEFEQALVTMGILAAAAMVEEGDFVPFEYEEDMLPFELQEEMRRIGDKLSLMDVGGAFAIPVLIPEGVETGDGRIFDEQSLTTRDLPLPLLWQIKTGSGHDGAVIVGRIDSIERLPDTTGLGRAVGVFDNGPYGREAERLVRAKMLTGVSADLDKFEANVSEPELDLADDSEEDGDARNNKIKNDEVTVTRARVMAATLLPKPAFQECKIIMVEQEGMGAGDELELLTDGVYEEAPLEVDEAETVLAAIAASAAPVKPPRTWFNNPELDKPTPLTIDDDGRVYGHIAAFNVDHIGLPRATKPPRSASNYAYFRTGVLRTEEGDDVAVGQLTLAGGHAPLSAGASAAVKHYDDTASAVADVAAGEDKHGIWVAGALRPGVTPEQVRVLRASAPSGDWRPINGRLELVAVCQVNVPGFPVARAFVASGAVTALVAAGASYMAQLRDHPIRSLEERMSVMEQDSLREKRAAALARLEPARRAHQESLTAAAAAARARMQPALDERDSEKAALIASADEIRKRMGFSTMDSTASEDDANF